MMMTEIRKQTIGAVEQISEPIISLAAKAKALLGYDVLHKNVSVIDAESELSELQSALKELEIEVLLPADVLAYQKERQIEQTRANLDRWLKEFVQEERVARFTRFDGPAWIEEKISEYKQPIPEFVLAKAVQIKQRVPECEIYVESLSDHPDPFLIVAIPDGRPYYPAIERYYVEVWAEPRFEGKLQAV